MCSNLDSRSPSSGNEGETLTVKGHTLSLTPSENAIHVGNRACEVLTAVEDSSYTPNPCPVTSCTAEMQTVVTLTCKLPYLDSTAPHAITLSTTASAGGRSPSLPGGTVSTPPVIRDFSPSSGSVAGGTLLLFQGDGFSSSVGDFDVKIGGARCRVTAANASYVACVTPVAADLTSSSTAAIGFSVRNTAASCVASTGCSFGYDTARTPKITGASVSSTSSSTWTITINGFFGTGDNFPTDTTTILIGGVTACVPTGPPTSSELECTSDPPPTGAQKLTLVAPSWGSALGEPALPTITGSDFAATALSPTAISLAGGATLTISGTSFGSSMSVRVCGDECPITSTASTSLECTAPSALIHLTGTQTLSLSDVTDAALELDYASLDYASPPPPPLGIAALAVADETIAVRGSRVVALAFHGITPTGFPRGATLRSAYLHVTPQTGAGGSTIVDVRASLLCDSSDIATATTPSALASSAALAGYASVAATVEWDMQPYDLGFASDNSPDFASLLEGAVASRNANGAEASCAVIVTLAAREGSGVRHFYGPTAAAGEMRPRLKLIFDPPTTVDQLEWAAERTCDVTVATPVPLGADDTCHAVNAASQLAVEDANGCPHLQLTATATTSEDQCAMYINGLDLFAGCGLDRLVVGRDGVCVGECLGILSSAPLSAACPLDTMPSVRISLLAARVDSPNVPRAACFDTRTEGLGAEQLASWIDALPSGAAALIVSCSRFAWGFNRPELASSLRSLGALTPPEGLDDMYALVGTKGSSRPFAEARTPCCLEEEKDNGVCHTCDTTPAVAYVPAVTCGASADPAAPSILLPDAVFGDFGSDSYIAAVSAITGASGAHQVASAQGGPTNALDALASLQADDVDILDAECSGTAISRGYGDRYGTYLATDGDPTTYWLSVGVPDALLTIDLGFERLVTNVAFDWEAPAHSVLIFYSASRAGSDWTLAASVHKSEVAPTSLQLTDGSANAAVGVVARRLRLYLADGSASAAQSRTPSVWPTNATAPSPSPPPPPLGNITHVMLGIREVNITSCALAESTVTLTTQLAYRAALTPTVTSVSPSRGSTAGGTSISLSVSGLPSGLSTSDVTVSVVGLSCSVTAVAADEITCLTSSYGVTSTSNPGLGEVKLTLPAKGTAATTVNATYEYVDLWSRRTTWGGEGNTIPGVETVGDSIWIQKGQRILLDADIKVYMLIIQVSASPPLVASSHCYDRPEFRRCQSKPRVW